MSFLKYNPKVTLGFTLIELLVVIAIISLLSSIVLASVNQARFKALAARSAEQLRQIELAFRLWANDMGMTKWWTMIWSGDVWDCDRNFAAFTPSLTTLRAQCPDFKNYLSSVPIPLPGTGAIYQYRVYSTPYNGANCISGGPWYGVTIRINTSVEGDAKFPDYAKSLDLIIDGEIDHLCGRLRYSGVFDNYSDSIYYHLGNDIYDFY